MRFHLFCFCDSAMEFAHSRLAIAQRPSNAQSAARQRFARVPLITVDCRAPRPAGYNPANHD